MAERDNVEVWDSSSGGSKRYISIYPRGRIGIPKTTHVECLDECDSVILKYSVDSNEIGLQPGKNSKKSFQIDENNRTITASKFLTHYNLIPEETERYPVIDTDQDTIWVDVNRLAVD